jgi:hypothetical protein
VRVKPFDRAAVPLAVATLLLAMVIAFAAGCGSSAGTDKGSPAPDFSGTTLAGESVSLSMYRGKPLVLAFMASW